MSFYKLFCLIYRRTDFYKLDRIRRRLMYPDYYKEKDKRKADMMIELYVINKSLHKALNHERY